MISAFRYVLSMWFYYILPVFSRSNDVIKLTNNLSEYSNLSGGHKQISTRHAVYKSFITNVIYRLILYSCLQLFNVRTSKHEVASHQGSYLFIQRYFNFCIFHNYFLRMSATTVAIEHISIMKIDNITNSMTIRNHKDSPIIHILSRINPIPRIETYFFMIYSNIFLPSLPMPY